MANGTQRKGLHKHSTATNRRVIKRPRSGDLDYPCENGLFGCPDSTCPMHSKCTFGSKNTAYVHFIRHSRTFAIIYRWNSEHSPENDAPSAPTDANSCFARLTALELKSRGVIPWLDKLSLAESGSRSLCAEVKEALNNADAIVICLAPGDLNRCAENSEDFFGFELQTALRLGQKGKPIHVLLHDVSVDSLLQDQIIAGMDESLNGLGSRLKKWIVSHRRYHVDLGVPDDNWSQIMDSIVRRKLIFRSKRSSKQIDGT